MELRPGYKKTEIGVIPEDWEVASLSSICQMKSGEGITSASLSDAGAFPVFGGNGLRGFTSRYTHEGNFALIGRQGALCGNVYGVSGRFYASEHAVVVTPFDRISIQFLTLFLQRMNLNQYSESSAQPGLSVQKILMLLVACPPYPEQNAIAAALSDMDASIAALSRLIAKKRNMLQGAMQRLLTGQTRLPGFTAPWQEKRLSELVIVRSQKINGAGLPIGTPCIELDQIASGSGRIISTGTATSTSVKNSFEPGDILFGRLRAYLRKFWLADRSGVCSTEIWPLVPVEGQATSGFVFYTVQRSDFIDAACQSYGTHMPRSDWGVVKNFEVLTPKPDEQTAIAQALSDMDAEITALDARLQKTRVLKQAMMQALLTGRVRLPVRRDATPQMKEVADV